MTATHIARTNAEAADLVQELKRRAESAKDVVLPSNQVGFRATDSGLFIDVPTVEGSSALTPYGISKTAHGQFAAALGIPKAYYDRMMTEAPALLASNVNTWSGRSEGKAMLRILDSNVRARMSNSYRALDSYDLFFRAFKVIREVGAEIVKVTLTDDRFEMRALHQGWRTEIGLGNDGDLGSHVIHQTPKGIIIPGIYISHSETGQGALNVNPYLQDAICSNGYVGEQTFRRVHLGERLSEGWMSRETRAKADDVLWDQVTDLCKATFDRENFLKLVAALDATTGQKLEEPMAAVDTVVKDSGMTDDDRQALINELMLPSHDRNIGGTVWGLISAITERAKSYETSDPDKATSLEAYGMGLAERAPVLVAVR